MATSSFNQRFVVKDPEVAAKLRKDLSEGAKQAVGKALETFSGRITDSDMFKYTPAYTGPLWGSKETV